MALYKMRDAQRKIALYKNVLIVKARESVEVTESAYLSSKGSFLDLIDAQVASHGQRVHLSQSRAGAGAVIGA